MKSVKFENITFGYGKDKPIFQNLSFEVSNPSSDKGHVVALMGASGSGKSTLLKNTFTKLPYVTLENPDDLRLALQDPRGFLAASGCCCPISAAV